MKQMISNGGAASMRQRGFGRRAASSGFSLVEVLVALAILIVGIFALIELFPPGFFTLQIAANDTAANRLAQAELEQLGANNINQLGTVSGLDSQVIGGVTTFSYDPIDNADAHLRLDTSLNTSSDIDGERAIQGETVRIPPSVSVYPGGVLGNAPAQLSVYVPNFAPIEISNGFIGNVTDPATGQLTGTTAAQLAQDNFVLKVGGLPWLRIVGDSTGTLTSGNPNPNYADPNAEPANDAPQYLIDYKQMKIAVGPEFTTAYTGNPNTWYPQPFNFTVQGTDGDQYTAQFIWDPAKPIYYVQGLGNGAGCQWFTLGANATWINNTTGAPNAPPGWQPGTDRLWRDFHLVYNAITQGQDLATFLAGRTFSVAFNTADPYSYAIADPGLSGKSDIGALAFNPTAAQIKDADGNPLMASISYNAADWHIIHEDHTLGSIAGLAPTVRLILKSVDQIGQAQSDNTIYDGIVTGMATPLDVDVVDLDTGQTIAEDPGLAPASAGGAAPPVDYNNGVVSFSTANDNNANPGQHNAPSIAGAHVRVFYRATGDWGLAVIKAASAYTPRLYSTAANADPVPPEQPAPGQAAPAVGFPIPPVGTYEIESPGGQPTTRLLFPGTDIGKLVRIENVTAMKNGAISNVYRDGNVRTIQPDPVSAYAVVMNGHAVVEHLYGEVDLLNNPTDPLTDPDGNLGVLQNGETISSVGSVVGASITARVLWKERDNWKNRDITTLAGAVQQAGG